jgi:hypothetical protein
MCASPMPILRGIGLGDPARRDAETLALDAAAYKRMWRHGGQIAYLFQVRAL